MTILKLKDTPFVNLQAGHDAAPLNSPSMMAFIKDDLFPELLRSEVEDHAREQLTIAVRYERAKQLAAAMGSKTAHDEFMPPRRIQYGKVLEPNQEPSRSSSSGQVRLATIQEGDDEGNVEMGGTMIVQPVEEALAAPYPRTVSLIQLLTIQRKPVMNAQ